MKEPETIVHQFLTLLDQEINAVSSNVFIIVFERFKIFEYLLRYDSLAELNSPRKNKWLPKHTCGIFRIQGWALDLG